MYLESLLTIVMFECLSVFGQVIYDPDSTNTTETSISESLAEDAYVYTVSGSSGLTFNKLSQTPSTPSFKLDPVSGDLTAPAGLDAENVTQFVLIFSANDGTTTVTSGTLTVNINNVNDNPPTFDVSSYTATILETVPDGYVITKINATDLDITYIQEFYITAGNTGSAFAIGRDTGELSVQTSSALDAAATPTYALTIEVDDYKYTATVTVTIHVEADYCLPNPCQNSGACSNNGTTFACNCAQGYIGTTCSDADPCYPNPCSNSGTCSVSGTSYQCACADGFSGVNCTDSEPNNDVDEDGSSPTDNNSNKFIIISVVSSAAVVTLVVISVLVYSNAKGRLCFKDNTKKTAYENSMRRRSLSGSKPSRHAVSPSDEVPP